jgi:hypothetical protein
MGRNEIMEKRNLVKVLEILEDLGLKFVPEKFPSSGGVAESRGGLDTKGQVESHRGRDTRNYG